MEETNGTSEVIVDALQLKYRAATVHPRSDVYTAEDLADLPPRDRDAVLAARARRQKRLEKRRR